MTDLLELLASAFAGFRFVLSRRYRERTLARWSAQRQMKTMQEVIAAGAGVLFVLLLPVLLWVSVR
jgi:hypothetical protein